MALLTYNWQEPNFDSLIANALHGEQLQQQAAIQQLEQQRLAKQQAASLALQLRQESRIADQEKFRQALESAQSARQDAATASLTAHRKAEDAYKYGAGRPIVASADGGDDDLASRYTYDPESGSLVTPVSSFGGLSDVLSGQDNGMFGTGGSSVLKEDGTPITEADIPDVRAHPEKYHDNPEPYAAFPQAMYASGAVKKGEKYWVSAAGPDGQQRWSQITARDVGPGAAGRGLDLSPGALKSLGVDTDAKVNVYLPGGESAIAGGGSKTPSYAAMIRNLPPEQQDRAMRQIAVRNATAQNHPRQTRLVSGTDGKSYRVDDDGVPIDPLPPGVQLGRMNSLYQDSSRATYLANNYPDGVQPVQINGMTAYQAPDGTMFTLNKGSNGRWQEKTFNPNTHPARMVQGTNGLKYPVDAKGDPIQPLPEGVALGNAPHWSSDSAGAHLSTLGPDGQYHTVLMIPEGLKMAPKDRDDYKDAVDAVHDAQEKLDAAKQVASSNPSGDKKFFGGSKLQDAQDALNEATKRVQAIQRNYPQLAASAQAAASQVRGDVKNGANAPAPLSQTGEAASSPTQPAQNNDRQAAEAQSKAIYDQAKKAFDSGDRQTAERQATTALQLNPHNAFAATLLYKAKGTTPKYEAPLVTTRQQFDALASGAVYVGSDGKKYRKP